MTELPGMGISAGVLRDIYHHLHPHLEDHFHPFNCIEGVPEAFIDPYRIINNLPIPKIFFSTTLNKGNMFFKVLATY
jgi:hypothetical protein